MAMGRCYTSCFPQRRFGALAASLPGTVGLSDPVASRPVAAACCACRLEGRNRHACVCRVSVVYSRTGLRMGRLV